MELKDLLKKYSEYKFLFVMPGGNWGDHLIYHGAEKLATDLLLKVKTVSVGEFLSIEPDSDTIVYIHGGGAFNDWCSDSGFKCFKHAVSNYRNAVIYGPCTCSLDKKFLSNEFEQCMKNSVSKNVYLFARENESHEIFKSIIPLQDVNISIDHDTALHLNRSDILEFLDVKEHDIREKYDLLAIREDNEASTYKHVKNYNSIDVDPPIWCRSYRHWLKVHLVARTITTNRTHSSIIGAILQKPTRLFSGSYHKNRSIWEYSLKEKGVEWTDAEVVLSDSRNGLLDFLLPRFVKNSWKVRSAYLYLNGVPRP